MGKIVAIGGGRMDSLETMAIDRAVVALSGKEGPRALHVPTASSDSVERWEVFDRVYRGRLGCETDVLYLLNRKPSQAELEDKILSADVIYVGGGNTLMMMRRWRRLGVDRLLEQAYEKGTVLAGVSAGMICWFAWGHSDSMSYYQADDWDYIRVRGMGLIDAIGCPHFNSGTRGQQREMDFQRMMRKHPDAGLAVDDHCAVAFVDDAYRVIRARDGVGAYRLLKASGDIVVEPLPQGPDFTPMAGLFAAAGQPARR